MKFILLTVISILLVGCFTRVNNGEYYLELLKKSEFGSAISTGTTVTPIYMDDKSVIVIYDNIGPETGHEMVGLVVFVDGNYHHDYGSGGTVTCKVAGKKLSCSDTGNVEKIDISDILEGNTILLGGWIACARHGQERLKPAQCEQVERSVQSGQ
ncbi:MAG: hypothetical protein ABIM50_10185 [Novosphingobium sp.]